MSSWLSPRTARRFTCQCSLSLDAGQGPFRRARRFACLLGAGWLAGPPARPSRSSLSLELTPSALSFPPFLTHTHTHTFSLSFSVACSPSSTLKYRNGFPVLNRARLVSKPSLHLYATPSEIRAHLTGGRIQTKQGLGMGEISVIRTKEGRYLEGWEAVHEGVGGEILCSIG